MIEDENQKIKEGFLDLSKYELGDSIKKDFLYKTYKIISKETNIVYFAKISKIIISQFSNDELINLKREVNIISQLAHPTFLKFIGYSPIDFKNKKKPVIVSEYPSNGSLKRIIDICSKASSIEGWDDTKKLINIYGIASGMSYLHSQKILHRNLSTENIFLDDYLFPKIGDFGLSIRHHNFSSMTFQSSHLIKNMSFYTAPEILESRDYTTKSDVYSFSFIVYEIITNKIPFKGMTIDKICSEVKTKCCRPKIDKSVPKYYKKLIKSCWSQNPDDRPSFDEIVSILKNNSNFIKTKNIKKSEFKAYIKYIEYSNKNYNKSKQILNFDEFIKKIDNNNYDNSDQNANFSDESSDYSSEESMNSQNEEAEEEETSELEEESSSSDEDDIFTYEKEEEEMSKATDNLHENIGIKILEFDQNVATFDKKIDEETRSEIILNEDKIVEEKSNKSTDLEELINTFISTKNPTFLMEYMHNNCDEEVISSVFDRFYHKQQDLYLSLCKEGISFHDSVSHYKYAILLIFDIHTKRSCIEAVKHLKTAIKQGYNKSYFLICRLLHEYFKEDDYAYKLAVEGSLKGEKYAKCILGFFVSHGIGTKRDFNKGVEIMLESGADDCYDQFATDIGIYYYNQLGQENELRAFKWFEKAFMMCKTKASINNYGICFLKGIGVTKNIEKAKEIFEIGIQKGYSLSKYHMAFILEKTDPDLSKKYYIESANDSNIYSKSTLDNGF